MLYDVPSLLVRNYVQRGVLFSRLENLLERSGTASIQRIVVLLGMGGIGKTQLALRYCENVKSSRKYQAVFWLDASSQNTLCLSMEAIAKKRDRGEIVVTLHSLVSDWLRFRLDGDRGKQSKYFRIAASHLAHYLGSTYQTNHELRREALSHLDTMYQMEPLHEEIDTVNTNYDEFGNLYADNCRLQDAERMYKRALAGKEKALGAEHTSTLGTINNLGNLYRDQGHLADAEMMHKRALAGKEKALGAGHTSTLATVNNLGILYKTQGHLADAETMYKRALAGYEKALGTEHTSTLDTVNNLGNLYADQGHLADA